MGLIPVPAAEVATVVTALEMRARPRFKPMPDSRLRLIAWKQPRLESYRTLFLRVGGPWLWFSRLTMSDERLESIIYDPRVQVFAVVDQMGIEVGMLELDFATAGQCELSYFGVIPELVGQGHGRWLMAHALQRAWAKGVECVWVHTCTLDHPNALGFYQAAGFVPVRRTIETFTDPRASGLLSPDLAPHVPFLARRR